ncbi:hypothetical protein BJX63DRAFT_385100, partial [Aspergillus granulosus]
RSGLTYAHSEYRLTLRFIFFAFSGLQNLWSPDMFFCWASISHFRCLLCVLGPYRSHCHRILIRFLLHFSLHASLHFIPPSSSNFRSF